MPSSSQPIDSPSRHALRRRPSWTRYHLIYFLLAAFDLLAVGTGLWLSHSTNAKFQDSVEQFAVTDAIRDNAVRALDAAMILGKPVKDIFNHGDAAKARADLEAAEKAFLSVLAVNHKDIQHEDGEVHTPLLNLLDHESVPSLELVEMIHEGMERWLPEGIERYEAIETVILVAHQRLVDRTRTTIAEFDAGRLPQATVELHAADQAFADVIVGVRDWFSLSDTLNATVVQKSVVALEKGDLLQKLIGAAIVVMVLMVVAYAHFMGHVLRRKFIEIEAAHEESEELSASLKTMNEDVTRLNVELNNNILQLAAAQTENLRKGRMEQLGQLTATVAHELRNPLGAVRTAAFLAARKVRGKGTGIEPQMERIGNGISRCDAIITQLLDFSRDKSAVTRPADIDAWLTTVLQEVTEALPAAVQVEFSPGLNGRPVEFDEARLGRAISNLVNNASEAMVGKGRELRPDPTSNPRVVVETFRSARGVDIVVSDNGPGITPENMRRIFEPLFTTKSFGTGLGLPAVQRIMEQHGGGLEAVSQPGSGARFTAWLPDRNSMPADKEAA